MSRTEIIQQPIYGDHLAWPLVVGVNVGEHTATQMWTSGPKNTCSQVPDRALKPKSGIVPTASYP
jgi:hypothetical protein